MEERNIRENDALLLEGILKADPIQLKKLYSDFLPAIVSFIRKNSGTEQDARDMFQEAILVIFKKLREGTLQLDVSLHAYLLAICRNMWLSQLRYRRSRPLLQPNENKPDLDDDTLAKIDRAQWEHLFFKHFSALGQKCRDILTDFFNQVPMKQIAARFRTSESYIKKRKHLCKEKLVEAVKNDPLYKEMTK